MTQPLKRLVVAFAAIAFFLGALAPKASAGETTLFSKNKTCSKSAKFGPGKGSLNALAAVKVSSTSRKGVKRRVLGTTGVASVDLQGYVFGKGGKIVELETMVSAKDGRFSGSRFIAKPHGDARARVRFGGKTVYHKKGRTYLKGGVKKAAELGVPTIKYSLGPIKAHVAANIHATLKIGAKAKAILPKNGKSGDKKRPGIEGRFGANVFVGAKGSIGVKIGKLKAGIEVLVEVMKSGAEYVSTASRKGLKGNLELKGVALRAKVAGYVKLWFFKAKFTLFDKRIGKFTKVLPLH